jgi:hypothetical protein
MIGREANEYDRLQVRRRELLTMQRAGAIDNLTMFPKVYLTDAHVRHVLTFSYTEHGRTIFERLKQQKDPRHKDLVKLWPVYGKGVLRLTSWRRGRFVIVRELEVKAERGNP